VQELSSFPGARAAVPFSEPHISTATGGAAAGPVDVGAGDPELSRMKAEIEAVRAEKERVPHLQALEESERELSRKINNRSYLKELEADYRRSNAYINVYLRLANVYLRLARSVHDMSYHVQ
jgi:hypothetical protein